MIIRYLDPEGFLPRTASPNFLIPGCRSRGKRATARMWLSSDVSDFKP